MGKDCASLRGSGARGQCRAHLCVRIRRMGKDCACLSVVLVLSAIARVGSVYVLQGLRLSLRVSCARVSRMLTCPLWCSTDAGYRRAENCGAPQLQFVDQVESPLFGNRDSYAQCNCAVVSCHGWCLLDS